MIDIKLIPISELIPNPNNPRIIKDDKYKKLVESLRDFPKMLELRPLVIDKDNIVIGGNMRLRALQELKYKEVPIVYASELTREEIKKFIILDNTEFGSWDYDVLSNEYEIEELESLGLDVENITAWDRVGDNENLEDIPEVSEKSISQLKDIYLLDNKHRVMCGDSVNHNDVYHLMNGAKAELLFTSPPYSDLRQYKGNKNLSLDNLCRFIPAFYEYVKFQVVNLGIVRRDNEIFQYWDNYINAAKEAGYKLLSWNVWNKDFAGNIGNQNYMFAIIHEFLFVFGTETKKLNRIIPNDLEQAGKRNKYRPMVNNKVVGVSRVKDNLEFTGGYETHSHKQIGTVTTCYPQLARDKHTKHPAMFPVDLPIEYILSMTNKNEIVIDPFSGSGTTLIACEQTNRVCYGMELEPLYIDVILKRYHKLYPEKEITCINRDVDLSELFNEL